MGTLFQDIRYALRQLRLSPTFALVAIASLALGIGANTAIFQLLDAVRLRSLPIHDPKELAEIKIVGGNKGFGVSNATYAELTRPIWRQIKEHHEPFTGVFAWSTQDQRIGQGSDARSVKALEVSGEFFPVLGIQAWRGRLFVPEDEQASCTISQLVVSYPYWRSQMGSYEITGNETLLIEGHPAQILGVTPPGFFGLAVGEDFDIAFPFCHEKEFRAEMFDISVMGRLAPGWTLERASAQMGALSTGIFDATAPTGYSSQYIQQFKQNRLGVYSASGGASRLRKEYDSSLWLLLAITGLVLLIACANLANLMLTRASVREREFGVRLALGASRLALLRQSLVESGLLAIIGTSLGVGLAQLLSHLIIWSLSTENNPIVLAAETDWRVLVFAGMVAVLTCVIFGAAPALRSVGAQPVIAMKSGGRGITTGRDRFSMQRTMVVLQISISLALLVGALLFVRSFRNLLKVDTGIRQGGITRVFVQFSDLHLPRERNGEFKRELIDEIRSIPGVLDAATTTNVPLLGGSWTHNIHIGAADGASKFTWVSPAYFKTMGISLQAGRGFTSDDTATSPRVAVVNQTFIRQFLGGANPIGQTLRTSPEPDYPATVYQIVGVIPDTKYNDIRGTTPPMTFAPALQYPAQGPWTHILIYSENSVEGAVKHKLAESHPGMVANFSDYQQDIRDGFGRERLLALLCGFFGVLAALLAMVGLYGVISYIVARRRNEIGIRLALGADRGQVVALMMREAARLLLVGVTIGTFVSLIAGRAAATLLFKLKPDDPLTLAAAVGLLIIVGAIASYAPAYRAAKVDPMVALRYE